MDSNPANGSEQSQNQATGDLLDQAEALIWSLLDDQINPADIKRLESMLRDHPAVRERYINCVQMHTDLCGHFGELPIATPGELIPKSPVLGSLGDLRPGTDTLPPVRRTNK